MLRRIAVLAVFAVIITGCTEYDPFQFTTFSLSNGTVGRTYADTIRTTGGYGNVSIRLVEGQLPPGIGMRQQDCDAVLYGQPSRTGEFQFTIEARDSSSSEEPDPADIVSQGFAITVDSL